MDWIVSVNYNGESQASFTRTIFRKCPKCKDERIVKASQIYDWYCPNCGQKMERPKKEIDDGRNTPG